MASGGPSWTFAQGLEAVVVDVNARLPRVAWEVVLRSLGSMFARKERELVEACEKSVLQSFETRSPLSISGLYDF